MWAKRFPVPEFDRYELKDLHWTVPDVQTENEFQSPGMTVINGEQALFDRFSFRGEHLAVVACKFPVNRIQVSGNSFAWPIQRAVITDSVDAASLNVLADWKTPRPMNTRFGPDDGISVESDCAYALIGHGISDYWVANRIMLDHDWTGATGNGFRILSSSEDKINDFHDAVVYFEW